MNEEELEGWAKEKAEVWVGRLRDSLRENPYKIFGYDAFTYMIKKPLSKAIRRLLKI